MLDPPKTQLIFLFQGCHKLIKAGADGVVQAMVLSFAGLAFRQQHLELNSDPKDLHRDYLMRRVSYGNSTHLNISIVIGSDNKAVLQVALDRLVSWCFCLAIVSSSHEILI